MSVTPIFTTVTASQSTYSIANFALTTVFTYPTSCSSLLYTYWHDEIGTSLFRRNPNINFSDPITSQCYPPNLGSLHSAGGAFGQYSPGVCPSGFIAVSTTESGSVHTSVCCPSGATFVRGTGCFSPATTSSAVIFNTGTYTVSGPIAFIDYEVFVAWAASDLDSFTPASAPLTPTFTPAFVTAFSSATSSPAAASSVLSIASPTSSSSSSSENSITSSSGISGGAIAGIVIGAVAAIALVLCGVFFCLCWKRRATRRPVYPAPTAMDTRMHGPGWQLDQHGVPAELPTAGHGRYYDKPELPTSNEKSSGKFDTRSELPGS